jgi:hypothetical protein
MSVRGGCLSLAKNAQRRENIGAREDGRVLETAQEAVVDVLGHPGKGGGACVRDRRGSRGP